METLCHHAFTDVAASRCHVVLKDEFSRLGSDGADNLELEKCLQPTIYARPDLVQIVGCKPQTGRIAAVYFNSFITESD